MDMSVVTVEALTHISLDGVMMTKQEAIKLIEQWFESVEIAEYEYMICASKSEPFWVEVKKAIDVIQEKLQ